MTQMKKTLQVVMLPTNEKAAKGDVIGNNKGFTITDMSLSLSELCLIQAKVYKLYILSDEEIKKGDWVLYKNSYIATVLGFPNDGGGGLKIKIPGDNAKIMTDFSNCKKIIATTDKSLGLSDVGKSGYSVDEFYPVLPQPSQSFIEYFVEEYNKGNVITEVKVEYEKWIGKNYVGEFSTDQDFNYKLKINPDNTINIKPKKDSWNTEEITPLIDFLKEIAGDDLDRVSPGIKMRAMTYLAAFEKTFTTYEHTIKF